MFHRYVATWCELADERESNEFDYAVDASFLDTGLSGVP